MNLSEANFPTNPKEIFLKDYSPCHYRIHKTDLFFDLYDSYAEVTASLSIERDSNAATKTLTLTGKNLELQKVCWNGRQLTASEYKVSDSALSLELKEDRGTLQTVVRIYPQKNTALEGLYRSGKMFCTQCEAEGFRKITYYLDRPDVMSEFTTRIVADKSKYPVLLSNGNRIAVGNLDDGRHWAEWHDPFLKPCYLFALVAGDLVSVDDEFETMSGRRVDLKIFVESKDADKVAHAMRSLKKNFTSSTTLS